MVRDARFIKPELSKHLPKKTQVTLQRRNISNDMIRKTERVVGKKFPVQPRYYTYKPKKRITSRKRAIGWDGFSQDVYVGKKKKPSRILITIPESSHKNKAVLESTLSHELAEVLSSSHGDSYSHSHKMGLKAENIIIRKHKTSRRKMTYMSKQLFNKEYGKEAIEQKKKRKR